VMKIYNKRSSIIYENNYEPNLEIFQNLNCLFLVKLHHTFQTSTKLYFIFDYVDGGELFFYLQKEHTFTEEIVRFYCAEIILGMKYLHEKGILYGDLKPENILLTSEGHICMTKFDISKDEFDNRTTFDGTPEYLAPEILEGMGYDKAADWWSFGILMVKFALFLILFKILIQNSFLNNSMKC
jgi:RAC serine/threonine-protein kinase